MLLFPLDRWRYWGLGKQGHQPARHSTYFYLEPHWLSSGMLPHHAASLGNSLKRDRLGSGQHHSSLGDPRPALGGQRKDTQEPGRCKISEPWLGPVNPTASVLCLRSDLNTRLGRWRAVQSAWRSLRKMTDPGLYCWGGGRGKRAGVSSVGPDVTEPEQSVFWVLHLLLLLK